MAETNKGQKQSILRQTYKRSFQYILLFKKNLEWIRQILKYKIFIKKSVSLQKNTSLKVNCLVSTPTKRTLHQNIVYPNIRLLGLNKSRATCKQALKVFNIGAFFSPILNMKSK